MHDINTLTKWCAHVHNNYETTVLWHPCKVHTNNRYVTTCAVARSKVGGPLSDLLHPMESASLLMENTHSMKQG